MNKIVSIPEQECLCNFMPGLDTNPFYTFPLLPGLRTKLWQCLEAILQDHNSAGDSGIKKIGRITQLPE